MKIAILGTRGIPNNYGGFEQCAEYLSVGLVKRGHSVLMYNPDFHPYKEKSYKGVSIIRKSSPQNIIGASAANFVYDYFCLKDAVNRDVDIVLELGLITSSLSIIFCRHKGKAIVTNLDGLEWKRAKWSPAIQKLTKMLEKFGVKFSDYLIADNLGIKKHVKKEYKKESRFIPYGAVKANNFNKKILNEYDLVDQEYILSICRLEPENNLEIMFDGYIESKIKHPYIVIGNHISPYGDYLKDKYRNTGILFLGGIYNKIHLDALRHYSLFYLHGHSVGGTNPALLEAMAAGSFILAHDNEFNRSVIEKNAYYFSSQEDVCDLMRKKYEREILIKNNFKKIKNVYNWDLVVDKYESYFQEILIERLNQK